MARRLPHEQLSNFGKRIEAWRKEHGLSQAVLAKLVGSSQRTLSDWVRIDGMPGAVHQVARLAALMGVAVEGLLQGDAGQANLRDSEYVERILKRLASPRVVDKYLARVQTANEDKQPSRRRKRRKKGPA